MSIRLNLAGAAEKVERGGGPIRPTWKPDDGDFHVSFLILSQGLFPLFILQLALLESESFGS